jgi:hypothetical protein
MSDAMEEIDVQQASSSVKPQANGKTRTVLWEH